MVALRFAGLTGVADFFAVLLRYGDDGFVFQINKLGYQLEGFLGAGFYAFAAAIALVRVNYDVVFA